MLEDLQKSRQEEINKFLAKDRSPGILLLEQGSLEKRVANVLGWDKDLNEHLENKGRMMTLEQLEEKYGSKVYTLEQIKKHALKYGLRLGYSSEFKTTDPQRTILVQRITDFLKTNIPEDVENAFVIKSNFFVLAPIRSFDINYSSSSHQAVPTEEECLLFYKPNFNEENYVLILKWGVAKKLKRILLGHFTHNHTKRGLMNTAITLVLLLIFLICIVLIPNELIWIYLLSAIISLIILIYSLTSTKYEYYEGAEHFKTFK